MHPLNEIRLLSGIGIDPKLERVVRVDESKTLDPTETVEDPTETITEAMANIADVTPDPSPSEQTTTTSDQYSDGDLVIYDNGIFVVVLSDPKTDMVGIIPVGLINASAAEKNRAVEMCKPDPAKFRKPTQEEIEAFKMSKTELAAVDDDMSAEFSAEGWDMKKAKDGGKKYAKDLQKKEGGKTPENKITKGSENEEGCGVAESTHNYAPGNKLSHEDAESDPINVVGQGEKQWANSLDSKEVKNEYTLQTNNRGQDSMTEEKEKVKVPSTIKSALKQAIKEFHDDAQKQGNTHSQKENARLFIDTAAAFQKILNHLEEGSVMDIKHAQIFAQTLMGPMLHKLPDNVWDFIVNGGQKRSLKDYMNKVDSK